MAALRGPRLTPDNRPDQGRQPDQPTSTDLNSRQTALDGVERVAIALAAVGKQAPRPAKSVLPTGKPPAIRADVLDEQESTGDLGGDPRSTDRCAQLRRHVRLRLRQNESGESGVI